ncbi:MAG TPA: hypothetical protein VJL32_01785 [Candidatus Paceibacterota bacterium]
MEGQFSWWNILAIAGVFLFWAIAAWVENWIRRRREDRLRAKRLKARPREY